MKKFFKDMLSNSEGVSSKRIIAFMCVIVLIIQIALSYINLPISENNLKVIQQIVDCFEMIILFVLGYSTIENIKSVFKKEN